MAIRKDSGRRAGNRNNSKKNAAPQRGRSRRFIIFVLLLILLLFLIGGFICLLVKLPEVLMTGNPRFTIKRIEVTSSGYWQGKDKELASRAGIAINSNIFTVDPGKLRRRILGIQNVDSCDVLRVLPDTLVLNLTERVPRAQLFSYRSNIVVDEYGKQFKRSESSAGSRRLPIIYGLRAANVSEQLSPALALIMTTIKDYPDISVEAISVSNPNRLTVTLLYRGRERCAAIFPIRKDYRFLLNTLQSSILKAIPGNIGRKIFDLQYSGRVVIPE